MLNDVQATGLAEARLGAARGRPSALIVAVGTGIGGALARDGQVIRGANGIAGSVGHMPAILRQGRVCSCGAFDHVEAYASGLQAAGVPVRQRTFEGVTHEFFGMGAVVDKANEAVAFGAEGLKSAWQKK